VPRWRFLATFLRPVFSASCVQQVSDLHLKFALKPDHVWKYGRHPICTATAEIRRGKKIEERKKERKNKWQDENIMVCPIPYGDHNYHAQMQNSAQKCSSTCLTIASESSQRTFADVEPSLRTPSRVPCFSVSFERQRPPTRRPRSIPPIRHNTGQT